MNILKQKLIFLNNLSFMSPQKTRGLFNFGLEILSLKNIKSLRSNARMSNLNWLNAKMKIYRLTSNDKILKTFILILISLKLVNKEDILAVDFSDFGNGFQVLMFAKQTKKGRAFPIYFQVLRYPLTERKDYQNLFIINTIRELEHILKFKLKLVFDRGFACPSIIEYLSKNGHIFYIRIKKIKSVIVDNQKISVKNIEEKDNIVVVYEEQLRLVISDQKPGTKEPWFLITNDFYSKRDRIIQIYYHRFEIEEFFRDAKRLFGLEYVNFHKLLSLKIVLWFVIVGMWFVWHLENQLTELDDKLRKSMELSIIRYVFEKLEKASYSSLDYSLNIKQLCLMEV